MNEILRALDIQKAALISDYSAQVDLLFLDLGNYFWQNIVLLRVGFNLSYESFRFSFIWLFLLFYFVTLCD